MMHVCRVVTAYRRCCCGGGVLVGAQRVDAAPASARSGGDAMEPLSAFDQFLEKIPFEKLFPCCFPSERNADLCCSFGLRLTGMSVSWVNGWCGVPQWLVCAACSRVRALLRRASQHPADVGRAGLGVGRHRRPPNAPAEVALGRPSPLKIRVDSTRDRYDSHGGWGVTVVINGGCDGHTTRGTCCVCVCVYFHRGHWNTLS
jgi:hypothetical protein